MTPRLPTFLVAATLLLLPVALAGQRIESPYRFQEERQSLGAFAGYMSTQPGSQDFGPQSASFAGIRYTIFLTGPGYAEAEVAYLPATRIVYDTVLIDGVQRTVGETDLDLLVMNVGIRLSLTGARHWHRIMPHILLGVGGLVDLSGGGELNESLAGNLRYEFGTSFAGLLGTGVTLFPTQRLGVRLDARANFWQVKTPEGFLLRSTTAVPEDEWTNNLGFSAGLSYHF
jgi:hypothetical protein